MIFKIEKKATYTYTVTGNFYGETRTFDTLQEAIDFKKEDELMCLLTNLKDGAYADTIKFIERLLNNEVRVRAILDLVGMEIVE